MKGYDRIDRGGRGRQTRHTTTLPHPAKERRGVATVNVSRNVPDELLTQ